MQHRLFFPSPEIVHCTFQSRFQVWKKVNLDWGSGLIILQKSSSVAFTFYLYLSQNVYYGFEKFDLQPSSANNGNHLYWLVWKSKLIDPAIFEPFTEHENRQYYAF